MGVSQNTQMVDVAEKVIGEEGRLAVTVHVHSPLMEHRTEADAREIAEGIAKLMGWQCVRSDFAESLGGSYRVQPRDVEGPHPSIAVFFDSPEEIEAGFECEACGKGCAA